MVQDFQLGRFKRYSEQCRFILY